jgi:formylglycine-generating enzyme required for sulfatase activity
MFRLTSVTGLAVLVLLTACELVTDFSHGSTVSGGGSAVETGNEGENVGGSTGTNAGSAKGGKSSKGSTTSRGGSGTMGGTSSTKVESVIDGGSTSVGGATAAGGTNGGPSSTGGLGTGGITTVGGTVGGGTSSTGGVATGGNTTIPPNGQSFVPVTNSCQSLATTCRGESCCTSIAMPGGSFPMGASASPSSSDYDPNAGSSSSDILEHQAKVAAFALDKYEVTVGRFRKFVGVYNNWHVASGNPTIGVGQHPIAGRTGWGQSWQATTYDLPENKDALTSELKCDSTRQTWKDDPSTDEEETYPINCIDWFLAFAFCIWDGGRLPTEAEWEYVAAGGSENRLFPWGSAAPTVAHANYEDSNNSPRVVVGSKPTGVGYFTQLDLAGSVSEWTFDWYHGTWYGSSGYPNPCTNCVNNSEATQRVYRGGSFVNAADQLRTAIRGRGYPSEYNVVSGIRCARKL